MKYFFGPFFALWLICGLIAMGISLPLGFTNDPKYGSVGTLGWAIVCIALGPIVLGLTTYRVASHKF